MRSGLIVAGALACGLALELLPSPFGWIGITGFAALVLLAALTTGRWLRLVLVNAAFLLLVAGLYEFSLGWATPPRLDPATPAVKEVRDDVVGYRLPENVSAQVRMWFGDEIVYDVVYTTDEHGLRVAPPAEAGGTLCVLFFGGSFAFGTGVNDSETSPFLTGVATGGRHAIHNFAYRGYGAHQMLALLESGRVEEAIDCTPTHAIYHSVHDHVRRVAGRAPWDRHGPRYRLERDLAVRRGNFDDEGPSFAEAWPRLARSHVLRRIAEHFEPGPHDWELFAAVVDASRRLLTDRYPGVEFHVLLWNKPWKHAPEYWETLQRRGIRVHFISDVLPNYPEDRDLYGIGPHDGHPNPSANAYIADYVAAEILGDKRAAED